MSRAAAWEWIERVSIRFAALYFVLFFLPAPLDSIWFLEPAAAWYSGLFDAPVEWLGVHVLGYAAPIRPVPGCGDTPAEYARMLLLVGVSSALATAWAAQRSSSADDRRVVAALRVYSRYAVGIAMLFYGISKVFPLQFPTPGPVLLETPIGESSLMHLLWAAMGAAPVYMFFGGAAEVIGGALLLFRRTTLLGALIVVPVMANVVVLNFAYDICVKVYSTHILLLTALLVVPDARRLLRVLLLSAADDAAPTRRREVLRALCKWGLIAATCVSLARMVVADEEPQPLRGAWDVASFSLDGRDIPDCASEPERWRTVVIEDDNVSVITARGARERFKGEYAADSGRLKLEELQSGAAYQLHVTPSGEELAIEGAYAGADLRVRLKQKTDYPLLRDHMRFVYLQPRQ